MRGPVACHSSGLASVAGGRARSLQDERPAVRNDPFRFSASNQKGAPMETASPVITQPMSLRKSSPGP